MHKHNIENPHIKKLSAIEKIKKAHSLERAFLLGEIREAIFFCGRLQAAKRTNRIPRQFRKARGQRT